MHVDISVYLDCYTTFCWIKAKRICYKINGQVIHLLYVKVCIAISCKKFRKGTRKYIKTCVA